MVKEKRDSIAGSLQCVALLEKRTSLLYRNLANRVDLPFVKSLLLHIAYDSQKHSEILKGMYESIGKPKMKTKDCEKRWGPTWRVIDDIAREISDRKAVSRESLPSLMRKLTALESSAGEEYYVLVQLKTLQHMTKEIRETYNVDLQDLRDIFEIIIRDEEIHTELLSKMKKFLIGNEEKTTEAEPTVRYTNPDAWSRAMPDSVYEGVL